MNTRILLLSLLLKAGGAYAEDRPPMADGQFAVLKPQYACEVNVPSGRSSSQVYFSKDCQTAYILPSLNMKKTVLTPYFIADSGICQRFEQVKDSLLGIEAKVTKIDSMISNLSAKYEEATEPALINALKEKMDYLTKQRSLLMDEQSNRLAPYYQTAAVRAQVRVESDVMDEVAAFQAANIANISSTNKVFPVRFAPAQIVSGILAISPVDEATYKGRSVLKANFPGTRYVPAADEKDLYEKDAILLNMNGSMSGIVDLSAVTYCSALDSKNAAVSTDKKDLIEAFNTAVALNYDYQVKVQAGVRIHMKSTLSTQDFLSRIQSKVTNSAFERSELIGAIVEGGVMNSLEIQLDDKGEQIDLSHIIFGSGEDTDTTSGNMIAPLISKFIKTHLAKVEAKLEQLGVLTKIDEVRAKDIKAGTTTEVGGYQSICTTTSKWFGLSKSTYCHNEPVYVQINHDGISSILKSGIDNSTITDEVNIETNQTTLVRHTSTFGKN